MQKSVKDICYLTNFTNCNLIIIYEGELKRHMAQLNSLIVTGNSRFINPINGNARNGVYFVKGTQTASTSAWTGAIPVPALYDGLTIMYYLPYASTATSVTLNLTLSNGTTTGAVNCYIGGSNRITTHFGVASSIKLTYYSAGSISISGTATTDNRWISDGQWNSQYNFSGTTFYSGNSNTATHDANAATYNGVYYYSSNGPATSLGATTTDGALYAQAYSTSWVGQIAQDYRNGNIFVRGKNNGTWTAWKKVDAGTVDGHTVAKNVPSNAEFTDTTYSATTANIGSASAGTAISADDITAWTTNTPTAVTKKTVVTSATFNNVVTSASGASASYANGILTFTNGSFSTGVSGSATTGDSVTVTAGTAASLSYTARSIPNISVTTKSVVTGITES